MSTVEVQLARRQWEEGGRRFDEESTREPHLLAALEVVNRELRVRIGQTFTLEELAFAYDGAEDWTRTAIADHAAFAGWPRWVTTVLDSAFHAYSRGAIDYRP